MDCLTLDTLPGTNSHVLAPADELDFFDRQSVELAKEMTPLEAWDFVMDRPMPMLNLAFKVRDSISSRFGVKRISGFSGERSLGMATGDYLDFFRIEHISDDVLTLSERDRHLDVLTCISVVEREISITSSVQTHNLFGKVYMLPVAPAHKVIVKRFLKRLSDARSR